MINHPFPLGINDAPSAVALSSQAPLTVLVPCARTIDGAEDRWAAGPLGIRDHPLIHFGPSSFCHFLGSNFYGYPGSPDFFSI